MLSNRRWRLARPVAAGELIGAQNFEFDTAAVLAPGAGEVLIRTLVLGTSPAQRSYVSLSRSMHAKVSAGEVMRGRGVGVVIESGDPHWPPGTIATGALGWQDYALLSPRALEGGPGALDAVADAAYPLSLHLGTLGSAGETAYFGLTDVAAVRRGDTVLVSAAAGGVGSLAGQIARILGARVIGIAGGAHKCAWLRSELGFDAAIDYRSEDVPSRLADLCPRGIDVIFDNVGGAILDAALDRLAIGARIAICGFIATDGDDAAPGPRNYKNLLRRRARMQGFFVFDYRARRSEALQRLREWYEGGLLKPTEQEVAGLEHMPEVLASLFTGANRGVALCRVADDPPASGGDARGF